MNLKRTPLVLVILLLILAPMVNAASLASTLKPNHSIDMTDREVDHETVAPVSTLALDNSRILATSGMSTMFVIWNMGSSQYCANRILFSKRDNEVPCKLKAL